MVFKADTKLIRISLAAALLCFVAPAAHAEQKAYVGDMQTYVTKYEDTLPVIARKFDIGFNELRSANPYVDPWMPGKDVKMTIPTRHILPEAPRNGIVINLPEMRLYVFSKGTLLQSHPIGVGREGLSTPVGQTTVVRKVVGPIWRPTDRMRQEHPELPAEVGPGPDNPMGTHAMYLGWPQYAIHGTDKPYAIGRRASSGCIRMYPEDIISVYPAVPLGSQVTVVNQPVKASWIDNTLYLEAHPPLDQAMMIEENGGRPYYDLTDDDMAQILRIAGDRADLIDWAKVRSVIRNRQGYPVAVTYDQDGTSQDIAASPAPADDDNKDEDAIAAHKTAPAVQANDDARKAQDTAEADSEVKSGLAPSGAEPEEKAASADAGSVKEPAPVKAEAPRKDNGRKNIAKANPVEGKSAAKTDAPARDAEPAKKAVPSSSYIYNVNG